MLLIKYFSNTKQSAFNAGVLVWGTVPETPTAAVDAEPGASPAPPRPYLYRLMVGLWYMHM